MGHGNFRSRGRRREVHGTIRHMLDVVDVIVNSKGCQGQHKEAGASAVMEDNVAWPDSGDGTAWRDDASPRMSMRYIKCEMGLGGGLES